FYTGENISPDFNLCDYAFGFDHMDFGDRYYRMPLYLMAIFYRKEELEMIGDADFAKQVFLTKTDLLKKTGFCSFVYSNYLGSDARKTFFDKLSAYKQVHAGGGYLNNVGGKVANKLAFEAEHKFSIAFENSSRSGYTTEKIVSSLLAKTIPIYWGNPDIGREFNEKRFINCHRYKDFDAAVKRVEEIDRDNDLYLSIINEPVVAKGYDFDLVRKGFENFLIRIIDQPLDAAKRRTINPVRAKELEKNELVIVRHVTRRNRLRALFARAYKPFKQIKTLEKAKQAYFRKRAL
ncbi:MAG: hypothetical protein UY00_C0052G0001, partial [Candidatus Wolfebacteria bacterium GW2011_GWA1_47_6]